MPKSTAKTRKAGEPDTSMDLRLRMVFKRHLVHAKDALARASSLMDLHKDDFPAEDIAQLNHALLVVHGLVLKYGIKQDDRE